jgi:hypothetical protein
VPAAAPEVLFIPLIRFAKLAWLVVPVIVTGIFVGVPPPADGTV